MKFWLFVISYSLLNQMSPPPEKRTTRTKGSATKTKKAATAKTKKASSTKTQEPSATRTKKATSTVQEPVAVRRLFCSSRSSPD